MKSAKLIICLLYLVAISSAKGQTSFTNLNFENPILPLVPDGNHEVPIANAMPGWTGYLGLSQTPRVFYNEIGLGSPAISFHTPTSSWQPIEGSYSAFLQSQSSGGPFGTSALAQVGKIPASAMSITFYGLTEMQLTFAGNLIPLVELGTTSKYDIVGADISAFAGQTGELRFTMPNFPTYTGSYLDNIQFSNQPLPEPSALSLLVLGALLFGWRIRKAESRK